MRILNLLVLLVGCVIAAPSAAACVSPAVELGMDSAGRPNQRWIDAVRDRVDAGKLVQVEQSTRPFTDAEQGWAQLVQSESPTICRSFARMNSAVPWVRPPRRLHILIGDQAGDDAFTSGKDTIVLDLAVFATAYGPAEGQAALLDRIVLHEYTHLLLVPYLDSIGWSEQRADADPYLHAIRVLYNEGIANLRSIDDPKWVQRDGSLTPFALSTVAALEPVMLERLQGLEADPSPDEAKRLLRNISQGTFTGKWGAVPIAAWLQKETGGSPARLSKRVAKGPQRILSLAVRNADPQLRAAFQKLLDAVPRHWEAPKSG